MSRDNVTRTATIESKHMVVDREEYFAMLRRIDFAKIKMDELEAENAALKRMIEKYDEDQQLLLTDKGKLGAEIIALRERVAELEKQVDGLEAENIEYTKALDDWGVWRDNSGEWVHGG